MKKFVPVALVLAWAACAAQPTPVGVPPVGFVEGKVSIGPLTPVQRIDETPPPIPPEVYAAYVIRIYRSDGTTLVLDVKIDPAGMYRAALGAGSYGIGAARADGGTMLSRASPQPIEIQSGQTLHLDIDIDTGIRTRSR